MRPAVEDKEKWDGV